MSNTPKDAKRGGWFSHQALEAWGLNRQMYWGMRGATNKAARGVWVADVVADGAEKRVYCVSFASAN
jgi:hypothetical protein